MTYRSGNEETGEQVPEARAERRKGLQQFDGQELYNHHHPINWEVGKAQEYGVILKSMLLSLISVEFKTAWLFVMLETCMFNT